MNFFGHYFTDSVIDNEWHNLGLTYPDLFRDLFKSNIPDIKSERTTENSHSLITGIEKHLERDGIFHNSEIFKSIENKVKKTLIASEIYDSIPRNWFFVHVFSELYIDRLFVKENNHKVELMYKDFEAALRDKHTIDLVFSDEVSKYIFSSRLERIAKDRYIFAYTNNEKFIFSLQMIYQRVGIKMGVEEKRIFARNIEQFLRSLEQLDDFNSDIIKKLS